MLITLLILLVFLIFKHFRWQAQSWPGGALTVPKLQAHRGYWQTGARENTLEAFKAAAEHGYQIFELDVRLTADRKLVVFHDADLKRFLNQDQALESITYEKLKSLVSAPTLEEVLLSKERPPYINIELKNNLILNSTLEKECAQLIRRCQVQNQVMISSFNPMTLLKLSFLLPEVPRALLATEEKEPGNAIYLRKLFLAPYARVQALHLDHRFMTPEKIRLYKKRNIPVALWTVNEKEKAQAFLTAGALSIISDVIKSEDLN